MSKYQNIALAAEAGRSTGLGAVLLCELMGRLKAGIFGPAKAPRCLTESVWVDAGYAIDAPESMPAGACRHYSFPPEYELDPAAEQITVERAA